MDPTACETTYTQDQVAQIAREAARAAVDGVYSRLNLEKRCEPNSGISEVNEDMPRRIRELVVINGKERWLNGYSLQEICDHYVDLMVTEGLLEWSENKDHIPLFGEYMKQYIGSRDYKAASPVMRQTLVEVVNEDLSHYAKEIEEPTLLIWGQNDTEAPVAEAKELEKIMIDAALIILPGTHYAYLENLQQVVNILNNFF